MVMVDREVQGGVLRWVRDDEITRWRRQAVENLHNDDGRQVTLTRSYSTDKAIEQVERDASGRVLWEKPEKPEPRTGRETAELVAKLYADHMLKLRKFDPPAFRERVQQLRASTGSRYAMWNDDQLADRILEVCRAAVAEPTVQRVYERSGRGGGWRETQL